MLNRFCTSIILPAIVLAACARRAAVPDGAASSAVEVTRLTCEALRDPMGIDTPRPRLSWVLEARERDQRQTAYQIVAEGDAGVLWDSGKVGSAQQTHVAWGGPPLRSGQRVRWRVRVWDRDGRPSAFSAPARFEMGLLAEADWSGQWIAGEAALPAAPDTMPVPDRGSRWIWAPGTDTGEALFRATLSVPEGRRVKRARAVFAGDDGFVLSIGGQQALRGEGTGGLVAADVTALVRPGANAVAIAAVNAAGPAGVIGRIVVDLEEGPAVSLSTGAAFRAGRQRRPGWETAAPDPAWPAARELGPLGAPPWGRLTLPPRATPAPHLRRAFNVARPLRAARAYLAAVGYGELHVNGAKVSDHVLDPGFTRFDRRVLYVVHDVTGALRPGRNVVGVILGNGFYNQHAQDVWDFHLAPWRNTPRMRLVLRLEYEDGSTETVASDERWEVATGPILFDGVRNGEVYDARLARPDWATPAGADDRAGWRPAAVVAPPGGVLSAQTFPPMRVTETLRPARISEPRPGIFVFDFGQNVAGWARLHVQGAAGTEVTLRYGERLGADGLLDRAAIDKFVQQGPFQTDRYVLRGGGRESWEPRFTYHGFQYVEVEGFPGRPTAESLEARVVHTDFETIGSFASSNPLFDRIFKATLWSFRGNFHSVPTDCPHREKNGWTADAHLATEQAMFTFDATAAYDKWVRDMRDEMKETGELPGIVPTGGWGYHWGNGPAWDSALFLVPWYVYLYQGDRRLLTDSYEHFKRYVDYVGTRDYLEKNPSGWLGDWVPAKTVTPEAVTHAGYHHLDARIVAETARLLGRHDEAARYEAVAAKVKRDFLAKFFDPATAQVAGGSQTALSAALVQGLLEEVDRPRVLANLVADIEKKGGRLDTGVLGAKYLPWALTEGGRADVFYEVATKRDYPSWGHWFEQGATTLWEDWKGNDSRNHIFFGDITAWFFRALAGINPDPEAPGFERVVVRPHLLGDLRWVRAETRSVRGRVASEWRREDGRLTLRVTIPVNGTGSIHVPAAPGTVTADGGRLVGSEGDRQIYEVGSGSYTFVVAGR